MALSIFSVSYTHLRRCRSVSHRDLRGSGRASIQSPAQITVTDGAATATLEWSSPNYDYMLVNGEKYLPVNTEGNSVFEVPVEALDAPLTMIGDTVAMSTPHEVEYTCLLYTSRCV